MTISRFSNTFFVSKYMNDYNKNKELSSFKYWVVNNLNGWAVSQKLPVNGCKLVEDLSEFNEGFIKKLMKKVMKDIFSS